VVIDKPDETAIACPACQQGHLVQRRSRYGKIFHSCDRYPECQMYCAMIGLKRVGTIKKYFKGVDDVTFYSATREELIDFLNHG
ncbi:DUF2824 family protein, partial [Salmonella enterica subsp. enterica serovar Montevideo]|nr:DUF2824 family protein [Salmonella enterica subsp. enterica serovar Montevideo]